jgi:HlyD family secretion protein
MAKKVIPLFFVVALLVFVGVRVFDRVRQSSSVIRVSGNIEVTDAEMSFKIPGRVIRRLVDEGQFVKKGDLVAELDKGDLTATVGMRQADVQTAQAALTELEAGTRPQEIEVARAKRAAAAADLERAESDFHRAEKLFKTKVVAAEEFERLRQVYSSSQARLRQAEEELKLALEGPRREQIDQARARLAQSQAALILAQTQLDYATITSPMAGVVMSKNIEPGEYVAAGTPVVTIGDIVHVWLRAYIDETDLGRVKPGQRVEITCDTFRGKRYEGRVSFISPQAEFTPKNVQTEKERVKLVYRVKVDISNPNMELKPGMPADADIMTAEESPSRERHQNRAAD